MGSSWAVDENHTDAGFAVVLSNNFEFVSILGNIYRIAFESLESNRQIT